MNIQEGVNCVNGSRSLNNAVLVGVWVYHVLLLFVALFNGSYKGGTLRMNEFMLLPRIGSLELWFPRGVGQT